MENTQEVEEPNRELIKLFVIPHMEEGEFHEVSPEQLEEYLLECKEQKGTYVLRRNLYHQLGIIAKVDITTTDVELDHLLRNDVRTLLIQTKCNKPQDIEMILLKVNTAIDKFYMENSFRMPIGVAIEISGEQLITGRLRNDLKPFLDIGHIMVLTTNEDYKYCSLKEIVYVTNLWKYLEVVKVGDIVRFDNGQIIAKIVKCGFLRPVTVEVLSPGCLSSFMNVQIPYYVESKELNSRDVVEIDTALKYGAHFLVIADLKSASYLHALKMHIPDSIRIIGSINFRYVEEKFLDIADHILNVEAIWLDNLFHSNLRRQIINMIPQCHLFEKATLGTIPLQTCSDFKKLENHERIKQIDCLLIERSTLRKKFPLIAKKLLPVGNKKIEVPSLKNLTCGEGIVNFVLRTISSIPCQGIVVSNSCPKAALALAIPQIYCPVICVVNNDFIGRLFNLRRNLKAIVSIKSGTPIEYGVTFGRHQGIFKTGDFIISISESVNEVSEVYVNLRAYYLPPLPISAKCPETQKD